MVDCSSLSSTLYSTWLSVAPLCVHLFELEPGNLNFRSLDVANIKVQVVQARAAASVAAFFMASSLRSCAKKASEMNMHSSSKNMYTIKSRDCVDYVEIEYHSTSQYKGLCETCESECHKTFNLRPAPGGQACCDPGRVSLAKKCLQKRWWSCLQNNEVNWSYSMCMYVHLFQYMQNIKMYESKALQKNTDYA